MLANGTLAKRPVTVWPHTLQNMKEKKQQQQNTACYEELDKLLN